MAAYSQTNSFGTRFIR